MLKWLLVIGGVLAGLLGLTVTITIIEYIAITIQLMSKCEQIEKVKGVTLSRRSRFHVAFETSENVSRAEIGCLIYSILPAHIRFVFMHFPTWLYWLVAWLDPIFQIRVGLELSKAYALPLWVYPTMERLGYLETTKSS